MSFYHQNINHSNNEEDESSPHNSEIEFNWPHALSNNLDECANYQDDKLQPCSKYNYDSDDDEIRNCCEVFGYTIDQLRIVRWSDKLHKGKGFIKYFSDPYSASTTGDPFSDSEKVLGKIDQGISPDAFHPLVAACPEIIVLMERIVISKNQTDTNEKSITTSEETSRTISSGTTNNHTHGQQFGVGFDAEYSASGFATMSMNYGSEWNDTVTIDDSDEQSKNTSKNTSWSQTLNIDKSQTAFLNANIRYWNVGSAPIYECEPTISFILGQDIDAQTIATISAKKNAIANIITPQNYYPALSQNPLAFYTNDDFSWQSIILNFDQVEKLQKGTKLLLQTTQVTGKYAIVNADGETVINGSTSWDKVMTNIYGKTACITIFLKNGMIIRRRVAAKKAVDATQQLIPELTIQQAINLAFSQIKLDVNELLIGFEEKVIATINHVLFSPRYNEKIQKILDETYLKNFFSQKIVQGMNISIIQDDDKSLKEKLTKKYQPIINYFQKADNTKLQLKIDDYYRPFNELLAMMKNQLQKTKNNLPIPHNFSIENILMSEQYFQFPKRTIMEFLEHHTWYKISWEFPVEFTWKIVKMLDPLIIKWYFLCSNEDLELLKEFSAIFKLKMTPLFFGDVKKIVNRLKKKPSDQDIKRELIVSLKSNLLSKNIEKIVNCDWSKLPWLKDIYQ